GGRDNPYFWVPILGPICGPLCGAALYVKVLAPCVPGNRVAAEETAELSNKEEAAA
ncbi:aquaporin, partial [Aeromonas sanarellii]